MSLRTAGSVLVVFLWSVTVVLGQNGWRVTYTTQSICTLKGSTVELTCSYTYPRGLQVKVTGGHQDKTLTCSTTCTLTDNPTYIWYKNGHKVKEDTSSLDSDSDSDSDFSDADSYSCAVKGHEDLLSPAVYGPRNTSVSVSPSGEIVEGSSVTLTCSSDANPPVQSYTWWYKKNGGDYQSMTGPQHVFNQIQSSDTGEYYCVSQNEMGTDMSRTINMDVKYGPKNTSVSVSPSGEIVEGSSVTLTCSSDANPPVDKYTWYFQNETFLNGCGQMYNISNFRSEDSGHYHCEAWNRRGSRNSTALMIILPGKQTSVLTAAVGIIVVVLVLILCFSGFMKKNSTSTSNTRDTADDGQGDSSPVYDNISNMDMTLLQHRQLTQMTRMMFTTPASTFLAPDTRKCLCPPPSSCLNPRYKTKMSNTPL
ncbi:B-cell receptor CD22-like isoform X2 [Oncorhynchus tshawytscha]|uniref:B-cell receptor CD22-like isoform X2 n=1 Tax=Oncorhynchus tshawytscha TaxID=74940 RepID=UPI001C3E1C25|nr:B-cell receptor CD22-like isoform X2 [Oncorhynchus tshawytscha]